jgi:hypothetical protein
VNAFRVDRSLFNATDTVQNLFPRSDAYMVVMTENAAVCDPFDLACKATIKGVLAHRHRR